MKGARQVTIVLAGGVASIMAVALGLPLLAFGTGTLDPTQDACGLPNEPAIPTDGTPTILGPSTLTYVELTGWWDQQGRGQPGRLAMPIHDLIATYLDEGDAEGVRADIAFAQAIHETGWFTNSDTARNNFAGIAHYDGAGSGQAFPNPATGVRAQIQLLKKFAAGDDVAFANPDIAPDAGARATTWQQLAGTWATSPDYWISISAIYDTMLTYAGRGVMAAPPSDPNGGCLPATPMPGATAPNGSLTEVRGITVATAIAAQLEALLAAAEADGLHLTGWGYRSYDRQVELRRAHCGTTHYLIYEAPASECSPPTARPGTSMHEHGLAIDFENCNTRSTRCWQWLNRHAADYGFYNLPSEPWHWSIDGS